ncbi:MAG TPA: hypothetical protein VK826_09005 [Bacteroidia bacterium]|nr:hypothetical protein [Bacteroidia bacterium]
MASRKIEVDIKASSEADVAMAEKSLKVLAEKLSAKELDRLRQIVLYEPSMMVLARKYLRL